MFKFPGRTISVFAIFFALAFATAQGPAAQEVPKPKPEIQILIDQGKKLNQEFKQDDAIKVFQDAIEKARALGDVQGEGVATQQIGNSFYAKGNLLKAGEYFALAKDLYVRSGDKVSEIGMRGNIAIIKDNTGHPNEARPIYLELLEHYRKAGPPRSIANMLINLAVLESKVQKYDLARKYAEEAHPIFVELKDGRWALACLGYVANAQRYGGEREKAYATYEQIVREAAGKYPQEEATALGNLGGMYRADGDYVKALDCLQRDLKLRQSMNDTRFQASILIEIGVVYDFLGQPELALANQKQGIELSRKNGDRVNLAIGLGNMGVTLNQMKRDDEAVPLLQEALALYKVTGSKSGQASAAGTLSAIYRKKHQLGKAYSMGLEARALFRMPGYEESLATTEDSLGNILTDMKLYPEALKRYETAVEGYLAINNEQFLASTYGNMGRCYGAWGKPKEAANYYAKAINLFEKVRGSLALSNEGRSNFLTRRVEVYRDFMVLLVESGQPQRAFEIAQKTKGRSLLDLMEAGKVSLDREMTSEERAEEARLRKDADAINAEMVKEGAQNELGAKKRYAALKAKLAEAENKLTTFKTDLYARRPDLAAKRVDRFVTAAELARKLPADAALIEYVAGRRPMVFVVANRNGKAVVTGRRLNLKEVELAKTTGDFQAALSDPKKPFLSQAKQLYGKLIGPVASDILDRKRLVICPDGPLWDVSFGALSDGKFLAERFELSYAYSGTGAEATMRTKKSPKGNSMFIVANPDFGGAARFGDSSVIPGQRPIEPPSRPIEPPSRPIEPPSRPIEPPSRPIEPPSRDLGLWMRTGIVELPGTQREANSLAKLFPRATILTRKGAQESAFVQQAGQYRYIHVASHAFFNDASPMLSSVVLATPKDKTADGYLTAREIFDLKLNADLVVLSACNTARGEKRSGEGIVGLSWALFAAGAPAQVVSQWSVDDNATADLMSRFYGNLKKGQAKGKALQGASLSLMKSKGGKYKHPYYWAPFIIMGDSR